jgi:hypothetical protein
MTGHRCTSHGFQSYDLHLESSYSPLCNFWCDSWFPYIEVYSMGFPFLVGATQYHDLVLLLLPNLSQKLSTLASSYTGLCPLWGADEVSW